MKKDINKILEILFKYQTDNFDERISENITPCLRELSLYLKEKGVNSFLQEYTILNSGVKTKNSNLIAFDSSKAKNSFILFQGHVDTVPCVLPYRFKITSHVLKGRGAVDMKGSLAGMVDAFISLSKNTNIRKHAPALLITGDEEADSIGLKSFLAENFFPVFFAINGEPTKLTVGDRFKGLLRYSLKKEGEIGHSAYPKKLCLIEEMLPVICSIKEFLSKSRKIKDKKFGKTVGAFTVLKSGNKENQLPSSFKAAWNLRTVKNSEIYSRLFKSTIAKHLNQTMKVKFSSRDPIEIKLPKEIDDNLKTAFEDSSAPYKKAVVNFFTEGSLMNKNNILTVVFGPGDPSLSHVKPEKEIIKINEISQYSDILQNIVKQFNK